MTIEQFMQENYKELKKAASRISNNDGLAEELLHYCIEEFLKRADCREIVQSGGGRFYIIRIMMNQWKSTTSPFFHTYRRHDEELTGEFEDTVYEEDPSYMALVDKIRDELQRLPWYDRMLFDTFVNENHTVSSLARVTEIPRTSVSLTINRIRRHIKLQVNGNIKAQEESQAEGSAAQAGATG